MAVVGCGVLVVAFALPELATRGKWLLFGGGVMLTGAWLLLWRSSWRVEVTDSERLLELRRDIEMEALRLEKQRIAWRRQRALHFGEEEIVFADAIEDGANEPVELVAVA